MTTVAVAVWPRTPAARISVARLFERQKRCSQRWSKGIRTPALTRENADLAAVSIRLVPIQHRSLPAEMVSSLDGVKTSLPVP